MSEIKPRVLGRKEIRAIKRETGVDLHRLMIDVMTTLGEGEDVKTNDLLEQMNPDVLDAIVDVLAPNNPALDVMPYIDLTNLAIETLTKTFGGEVEKKS